MFALGRAAGPYKDKPMNHPGSIGSTLLFLWSGVLLTLLPTIASADRLLVGERTYVRIEQQVNVFTASRQEEASIAMDTTGRFTVVWDSRRQEGGQYGVYARRFDAVGRALGAETRVNLHAPNAQRFPTVALAGDATARFVWESFAQDGSGSGVYARTFDAALETGGPERSVGSTWTGNQSQAAMAGTADGRTVVVWTTPTEGPPSGNARRVVARVFAADGQALTDEFRVSTAASGVESVPCVAIDGRGQFVVVWAAADAWYRPTGIRGQRFDLAGRRLGDVIAIADSAGAIEPALACGTDGRFAVAWLQSDGEGYSLRARRFGDDGTPSGSALPIGPAHHGRQTGAAIALADNGDCIVAWNKLSPAGHPAGVFGQLFGSTPEWPAGIGEVFRVTQADNGHQSLAAATGRSRVAFGPEGQLVFAWSGDAGLGDGHGAHVTLLLPVASNTVGDVNADGVVSSADIGALAQMMIVEPNSVRAWAAADMNADGQLDASDADALLRALQNVGPSCDSGRRIRYSDRFRLATALAVQRGRRWTDRLKDAMQKHAPALVDKPPVAPAAQALPHQPPDYDRRRISLDPFGGDPDPHQGVGGDPGFIGVTNTGWTPPDPHLAVGPDHVVVMTNGAIAFLTKDGTLVFQDEIEDSFGFWGELGTTGFVFDPEVIYDPYAERFMAMACERRFGDSHFLLAISDDSNPEGDWFKFRLDVTDLGGGGDIDSPNIAVDQDVIYLTADFFMGGEKYLVYMLEKAPMLSGGLGIITDLLITGTQSHGIPVMYGPAPAMYLIEHSENSSSTGIRLSAITDPLGVPQRVTTTLTVDPYGPPEDPPQQGTSVRPETFDARFWSCVWRNGSLWATHHINSDRVLVRWYEIKTNDWPGGGTPEVVQSGEIDPGPGIRTFFSAISVNEFGDAGIVFARSSSSEFISMGRAVRSASDPLGTFQPMVILKESTSPYTTSRWGDYGGIGVDPIDHRTFWAHHEYATATNNWNTWVASFAPPPASDLDGDGDVDLDDYEIFQDCFGGPDVPPAGTCPEGVDADFDNDDDVDLIDFQRFQTGFN
ncbi:MAG: dockerin type I repeat-containing protein [Planctomycetes bacterium]|nr:dockerin type I repeat-containing protein [Planctomycetota bacterium]